MPECCKKLVSKKPSMEISRMDKFFTVLIWNPNNVLGIIEYSDYNQPPKPIYVALNSHSR
jgi:hypothetical protein